jgi:hypothetical protein
MSRIFHVAIPFGRHPVSRRRDRRLRIRFFTVLLVEVLVMAGILVTV